MTQCLHLNAGGRRCLSDAEEGLPFCRGHGGQRRMGLHPSPNLRRLAFRLTAFVLLVIFLIPLMVQGYRMLKSLLN